MPLARRPRPLRLSEPPHWHWALRLVHWITLLSVMGAVGLALSRDWVNDDDLTDALLTWHRQLGLLVLGLCLVRLLLRATLSAPDHRLRPSIQLVSKLTHLTLYLFLLGMPLLGWLTSNAHGVHLTLGPIHLPTLVGTNHDLGDTLGEWHEWGAWAFLAIAGLHALAALWHHIVLRDGVLRSMLGRQRQPL